jgi:hypothetical protein
MDKKIKSFYDKYPAERLRGILALPKEKQPPKEQLDIMISRAERKP